MKKKITLVASILFLLAGCAGTVNQLYVDQVSDFNKVVLPELLDGYMSNPDKTDFQKTNIKSAVAEHVETVARWAEGN